MSVKEETKGRKEPFNISTIGHVDHGKTTLTAAISLILSKKYGGKAASIDAIDKAPEEKKRGITINAAAIEYATETRRYTHKDCPGHADYVKNMISGAFSSDYYILVVAATDGALPQTREHLKLIGPSKMKDPHDYQKQIVVCINKVDMVDEDLLDLCTMDIEELLKENGFTTYKFFYMSALKSLEGNEEEKAKYNQVVLDMFDYIENTLVAPPRNIDKPFHLFVDGSFSIPGRGLVISGTIGAGVLDFTKNTEYKAEIIGFNEVPIPVRIISVESHLKSISYAAAGENVGVLIKGDIKREDVVRGMLLVLPGTEKTYKEATGFFLVLDKDRSKKKAKIIKVGYKPQFFFGTGNVTGTIVDIEGDNKTITHGEYKKIKVEFMSNIPLPEGVNITVRESGQTVGFFGIIKE